MINISQAATERQVAAARSLFLEYAKSLDFDLCFQDFDHEMAEFPGRYAPPRGRLFLATATGDTVGCIGLRELEPGIAELKRLYVQPAHRGAGTGRLLAEAAVAAAVGIGYRAIRLDTLETMTAANALYAALGFERIAPYRENPLEAAVYMELKLKE